MTTITLAESRVMLLVAGKSISFLVDMGATYSVFPTYSGPVFPSQISVMGIDGKPSFPLQTGPLSCYIERLPFTHSFLVIPSYLVPLLGRDVLFQLGTSLQLARLDPKVSSSQLLLSLLVLAAEPSTSSLPPPISPNRIDRKVCDTSKPIIATQPPPALICLKDPSKFPAGPNSPFLKLI